MTNLELATWSDRCEAYVRQLDGDAAHDISHIRRVVRWARQLADVEGADLSVVIPAAWLHDCVTVPKDHPDRPRASTVAAETASSWLENEGYPAGRIPEVAHAIEAHSFSAGILPRTIEAKVVQDADRLDALGAIGIARCYATSGAMGSSLVHPDDPVPSETSTRQLQDRRYATDHFVTKLLTLPDTMQTEAGRREAEHRAGVIQQFMVELARETSEI